MKLKNILTSVLAGLFILVGCQQEQVFDTLNGLSVSESFVGLPTEGGSVEVTVISDAPWELKSASRWITVSPTSGSAGETKVSFSVLKTKKERSGEAVIVSGDKEQHIEFIQAYVSEGSSGPREFIKVDKVQPNKLYLFVFEIDGKPHAFKGVTTAGNSGGYNYGYGEMAALSADEISEDKSKITLNHQDYSHLLKASGDGYMMRHLSSGLYYGNNGGYTSISHGDDAVPGSLWKFTFLDDGTAKIQTGSMWMHYSSKYGNVELTAADPAGDIPTVYEDTQDPELDELEWGEVLVSNVTATEAEFSAAFVYNGIEPLDGAGFIIETDDENVKENKIEIEVQIENGYTKFLASTDKLEEGVDYTVTAYIDYEGSVAEAEPVAFTTKTKEPKSIKVAEFVEILKGMEIEGNVGLSAVPVDYVEGIVTAVNGTGQNLFKGMTLEDGTGEPNSGVFLYANSFNNAFEPGTKVKLSLFDAVASSYKGLVQIVEGSLEKVSENNDYTLAKFSADTVNLADYVGMYVTVADAKCASEVGTVWNDGSGSNGYVDFTSNDGKVEFTAKTYKTSPWAGDIVGVKSTGDITGVLQVSEEDYYLLPNKAADVAAFANTDPEITAVSETSLTWEGISTDPVAITVTGEGLEGLSAGIDSDHWTIAVSGNTVTVTPNEMNLGSDKYEATLTITAIGGNSAEVALTHIPAEPLPEFTAGKYWIVASGKVATPLTSSYGYLKTVTANADNTSSEANLFTFTAVDGGFTIQDPNGKYYYQTGSYNSFNVMATVPSEGHVWTVEPQYDGTFVITNVLKSKTIQYDSNYGSYGSYSEIDAVLPVLVAASSSDEGGEDGGDSDATASVTFADKGFANAEVVDGVEIKLNDDVAVVFGKGEASTAPAYYDSGSAIRMYQNGATLDVKAPGKTITKIELTFADNHYYLAADSGTLSEEAAVRTWTGEASAVKFTSTGTDKNHRAYVSAIKVYYK